MPTAARWDGFLNYTKVFVVKILFSRRVHAAKNGEIFPTAPTNTMVSLK